MPSPASEAMKSTIKFRQTRSFNHSQFWIDHYPDHKTTPTNTSYVNDKSLYIFGNVAHTVADGTSPEHVDAQGNPMSWNPVSPSGVEAHFEGEATIAPEQMNSAVTAVQQLFQETYGQAAVQQAATPPPPPPKPLGT
jgi:hypothetical protein